MTWQRVDLAAPEFGEPTESPATCGLIYRGKRHTLSGAPEAAKTLTALILGLEHMRAGHGGLALLDLEMGEHATRLLLEELGATPDEVRDVYYVAPEAPPETDDIEAIADAGVTLVVVDAAAGAYDVAGLDDNKRSDAERFSRGWITPLWLRGIATIVLDHVVKNGETRGRYAIGSERKLGAVDVHLGLEAITQLHRGATGLVRITTHKDRPGHLPRPHAADLHLASDPDTHAITWELREPVPRRAAPGAFRPSVLMGRLSQALELHGEPISPTKLVGLVQGKREWKFRAIDHLIAGGYVVASDGAHRLLTHVQAFSEEEPVPGSQDGSRNGSYPNGSLGSPLTRGNREREPVRTAKRPYRFPTS
jgi:hypothetical protein